MERFSSPPDGEGVPFLTIAEISSRDFYRARQYFGFSGWDNYQDFCVERECLQLGYESAGVRAPRQRVPLAAFQGWSRLTGAPLDLDGLDEFAAHWRYRAHRPVARARGQFGAPGQPERHAVAIEGEQLVVVSEDVYVRWRDEFSAGAPFPPPDLDAYAMQVVACCLASSSRARRSAVKIVRKSASELDER